MERTFDFSEPFQVKILGLLCTGVLPCTSFQPAYFQNPLFSEICESIVSLRTDYGEITSAMVETHLLRKEVFKNRDYREELTGILPEVFALVPPLEIPMLTDLVGEFQRFQEYHARLLEGREIWQRHDPDSLKQLDELFAKPIANGHTKPSREFYFSSLPERLKRRNQRPDIVRTLIPELDLCLEDGGFARKSLALFAALTGRGKSFALCHLALVSVLQGKKVVYYSLEMTRDQIQARMDAQLSGVKTFEIRENAERVREALGLRQHLFGDNLLVEELPAGSTKPSHIRADILDLQRTGFTPEVVIVDYMNLMSPDVVTREGRHQDLGSVYIDFLGLAKDLNAWIMTAAQANRLGYAAELLSEQHLSDSFQGAQHSTYVVTINRNIDEEAQEKARLYIAKDRTGLSKKVISINTNYSKGAFFSRRGA